MGRGGVDERALYFAHIAAVDEWPKKVDEPRPHFIAVVAMDASSVDGDKVAALAKKLMNQGMVYLYAWGPDARRVHDIFDVERGRHDETDDAFVATSWFEDEDLDDAIWDAVFAVPADAYIDTCRAVVAIVVDQAEWSDRVEAALTDFEAFNREVLARDTAKGTS